MSKMKSRKYFRYLRKFKFYKRLRKLNPFYNKTIGPHLIPSLYFFNKIFCLDLKPVPYSLKANRVSENINKRLIESIKYEIRLTLLSVFVIVILYNFIHFIIPNIKEIIYYVNVGLCGFIFYLMFRVIKRIIKTGKMHCDANTCKFIEDKDKV